MNGLWDKVAVVTGAGGGIGRQICRRLAASGCHVALFDLNEEGARQTVEALSDFGVETSVHVVDIVDHGAVGEAVKVVLERHGRIDILINNAGWDIAEQFVNTAPEFWQKVIDINYLGPLNLHHHVLPLMVEQRAGKVVNIASDAGRVGSSGESVYAGCKAAVVAFGKSVAREVARSGICINAVCPGPTDTNLFREFAGEGEYGNKVRDGLKRAIPMRRLGEPEDIAGIVAFLASDDADYITGQTISVSGGLTMHG
jgi:2-hydroxycyclohexanecarboxyl-CoA dehydrogenase